MTEKRFATIGGLEMTAPLHVDVERRLYPIIREGRRAAADLESEGVVDPTRRRELLRRRHDGQEAEAVLLRATLGLVRARVVERGYRFGNDELEAAGVEGLVNALQRFDPDMKDAKIDLDKTFDARFVAQATAGADAKPVQDK